jgi:hypothetical protein
VMYGDGGVMVRETCFLGKAVLHANERCTNGGLAAMNPAVQDNSHP